MVLQALNRYYETLLQDPESDIAPPGYSVANVSFALVLSEEGDLLDLFPLVRQLQAGKKTIEKPMRMIVPAQVKKSSNIAANFLCENCTYLLGISDKNESDPSYVNKRFEEFRKKNRGLLETLKCKEAKAVVAFCKRYTPETLQRLDVVKNNLEGLLAGGNLVFKLNNSLNYVHDAPEIKEAWEKDSLASKTTYKAQCLVTGEIAPVARVHPNIKGVKGGNASGGALVGFNARAFESFNRIEGQGLNSPTSERAAFAYTTALNYLLSPENPNRKFVIGDTTVVYWAESEKKEYGELFTSLFGTDWAGSSENNESDNSKTRDKEPESRLRRIAEKIEKAETIDLERILQDMDLDPETRFFVLGLAPNSGRISVRFFHADPFLKTIKKIKAHYDDMAIEKQFENQPGAIPLWQILNETISKRATDKTGSPLLAGAVMRAILENTPYPAALFYAVMNRIHADVDDKEKRIERINYERAAIIKAYLLRKYRTQNELKIKEVLTMTLNEESTQPAYLLGRLFAVLEKAQQDAIGDANATIKDRYFTSACASPASVFPILLRLSQHHISRAEYGRNSDRRIQDILELLDVQKNPFPAHLTLDAQGIFVLGYYHQKASFYRPRNQNPVATTEDKK